MIIYGRNAVREALRGPRAVHRVHATAAAAREPWLRGIPVETAASAEIERLCGSAAHQGLCAEVEEFRYADATELLRADDAVVVCLDQVQDPQNLGSVCRSAECAGATGVVVGERRAAAVTAAVCKASAGAVEHLAVARVRNVADYLAAAKRAGAWVYGASAAGERYDRFDYRGRVVIVFGAEGSGLRPRVAGSCDALIALPLRGRIESLNVGAAASAVMYGILHFRAREVDNAP